MPWLADKIRADPRLGRVEVNSRDFLRAISMNVAVPPFDDIHVRRAVNYILDKRALIEAHGGDLTGRVLTHYVPDSLENDALSAYDPYATPDEKGSLELARQEQTLAKAGHKLIGSLAVRLVRAGKWPVTVVPLRLLASWHELRMAAALPRGS